MLIGVPTETLPGERRVALVPEVVRSSRPRRRGDRRGGRGAGAIIPDALYGEAGAAVSADEAAVWGAPLLVKVSPPTETEVSRMARGAVIVAFLNPLGSPRTTRALAAAGLTAFAMEAIPRISRAQAMDALSSQSNVAGYRAALLGAEHIGRFFPDADDRGGDDPARQRACPRGGGRRPAGARHGATARRPDHRLRRAPEVAEQVKSLGAEWLDLGIEAAGEGGYAASSPSRRRPPSSRR